MLIPLAVFSATLGIFGCEGSGSENASIATHVCKRVTACTWSVHLGAEPAAGGESFQDISCPAPTICIAVGNQSQTGKAFAEEWDGRRWESIGTISAQLRAISCPTDDWCMVVGDNPPGSWSLQRRGARGSVDWVVDPLPVPHSKSWSEMLLNDVSCTAKTNCTAAGNYLTLSYNNYAARWDGRRWNRERPPNPKDKETPIHGMLGLSCPSSDFCVTVGAFKSLPLVEQWDGGEWKIVPAPHPKGSPSAFLESVFCTSPSACMAVGTATLGKTTGPFAERWDGSKWSIVKTPPSYGQGAGDLRSVFCLAESSCMAVGGTVSTGQTGSTIAMSWNGKRWMQRPSPDPKPFTQFAGVSCPGPRLCMAVGEAGADWASVKLLAAELTKPWSTPAPSP